MPIVVEYVEQGPDGGDQLRPRVFCDVCGEPIERLGWALNTTAGQFRSVRFVHSDRDCDDEMDGCIGIRRFFELLISEGEFVEQDDLLYGNRDLKRKRRR
jgi:hypothetical protein